MMPGVSSSQFRPPRKAPPDPVPLVRTEACSRRSWRSDSVLPVSTAITTAVFAIVFVSLVTSVWLASSTSTASPSVASRTIGTSLALGAHQGIKNGAVQVSRHANFHPPFHHPSHCFLLGSQREAGSSPGYSFNARSFCLTSGMCVGTSLSESKPASVYFAAPLETTKCSNVSITFKETGISSDCLQLQSLVHCAHGRFLAPDVTECPSVKSMAHIPASNLTVARWLPGIVVVVPNFAHVHNIFHFSFILGTLSHLVSALPSLWKLYNQQCEKCIGPLPVTILFRGKLPRDLGNWQAELLQAILDFRISKAGVDASVTALNEGSNHMRRELVCARSSLFIGNRSDINIWPFPSARYPNDGGTEVGVEAVGFRHAVYSAMEVNTSLPPMTSGALETSINQTVFDLPPLAVGYARRNLQPDASNGMPQLGTKRRFSDSDELWFESMLREEAEVANMTYTRLQVSGKTAVAEQVRMFSGVGFVAGIHGANLMNAIFMKPFSAMLEVFPARNLPCYAAGANSGLAYYQYSPTKRASGEQSGCTEEHRTCWLYAHNRRVLISDEADRIALRALVKDGLNHILSIRKKFEHRGGVPVLYDRELAEFKIDWDQAGV